LQIGNESSWNALHPVAFSRMGAEPAWARAMMMRPVNPDGE
jgi:hypothetical protein